MEDRGLRPHFPRLLARSFPFLSRSISAASLGLSRSLRPNIIGAQRRMFPCCNAEMPFLLLPLPPSAIPSPAMNSLLLPPDRPRPKRPRPTHTHFTPVLPSSLSFPPSARCAAGQTAGDARSSENFHQVDTPRQPDRRPTDRQCCVPSDVDGDSRASSSI